MTAPWIFAAGAAAGACAMAAPRLVTHFRATHAASRSRGAPTHTVASFAFTVRAPMEQVAPLFGADGERAWAPGWNPAFVFPATPSDVRGMVFQVAHGGMNAVWVNTDFDLEAGRVQYAYVIPDALVTLITIRLTPQGHTTTSRWSTSGPPCVTRRTRTCDASRNATDGRGRSGRSRSTSTWRS